MKTLFAAAAFVVLTLAGILPAPLQAQQSNSQSVNPQSVWVQIAARGSLREALEEAQGFAARIPDVSGFSLGGGWYGILIGPYSRDDAERVLQVYRSERQIPRDSFIAFGRNLGNQFYPTAADANAASGTTAPTVESPNLEPIDPNVVTQGQEAPSVDSPIEAPTALTDNSLLLLDETPAEARRSEAQLSRDERKALQIALQAAGFYNAAIDGAFGRGTRRSMGDWQAARGLEPTGVLTTAQRQALLDEYNAPLISVGMASITDDRAGIRLQIPSKEVAFNRYESPFAIYESAGDLGAELLLISQPGDQRTLFGLFEIMQTLEIVPLDGPRERSADRFSIEGRNSDVISYTEARLINGQIKGFTLVWPTGDDARRDRVLAAMQTSFAATDGVLDPTAGADAPQSVDLIAGLNVRKPRLSRSGFYVDGAGSVVTTLAAVNSCGHITLDHDYKAEVIYRDDATGVAVLRPQEALAPMNHAQFARSSARLQSEIAVSGFSYEGVLGAPSLTFGTLQDVQDLQGNTGTSRLQVISQPGDAGGPVLSRDGAVQGMLLDVADSTTQLPDGVRFAANAASLQSTLDAAGIIASTTSGETGSLPIGVLTREASGMTVLVNCWD
ncbi:peptidoglycan-binding protein [Phaeobacter sp.]|uniref:peptidoglycan-binding protein n=1 Tax=Phaeobacter sp. TaxID=1902409 RepID=UPI0025DE888A|nr:peptidoglycan-binding protein [Phaeobacter sp.]